ncbi:MAG: DNA-3-methyladenine glycosylase I [Neisseria sp.]|nr:DNA-3-methyladenine glycosylase I [Neisseria sp.]
MTYCQFANALPSNSSDPNKHYHDCVYGFAVDDDRELFKRLVLEINQAGLSWTLILKKEQAFDAAYADFDIAKVAAFDEHDVERLKNDAGIIRNRLKIQAAIHNAQVILGLQKTFGSFKNWLDQHKHYDKNQWLKLFKQHFQFVGGEIVGEFLMSTGYLAGAHDADCPVAAKIQQKEAK